MLSKAFLLFFRIANRYSYCFLSSNPNISPSYCSDRDVKVERAVLVDFFEIAPAVVFNNENSLSALKSRLMVEPLTLTSAV